MIGRGGEAGAEIARNIFGMHDMADIEEGRAKNLEFKKNPRPRQVSPLPVERKSRKIYSTCLCEEAK